MSFTNTISSFLLRKNLNAIEIYKQYPSETQFKMFNTLVKKAVKTEFGRRHGFQEILSIGPSGLSDAVPLNTEMPIDAERKTVIGLEDVLAVYLSQHPDTTVFGGKCLVVADYSMMALLPSSLQKRMLPSSNVLQIENWKKKLDEIAKIVRDEDVTMIFGMPSFTLMLCTKLLTLTGKSDISQIWPNLQLFVHFGMNFDIYRPHFQDIMTMPKLSFINAFCTSNGFYAFQDNISSDSLLLMLDNDIYYEFVPQDEFKTANRQAIAFSEIKTEVPYAMVVSTVNGLWRYITGDMVEFVSLRPHKIKILGKIGKFSNAFGENLVEEQLSHALRKACNTTGAEILSYDIDFEWVGQSGRHLWKISFAVPPNDNEIFEKTLDFELRRQNSKYDALRYKDVMILMPKIVM